MSESSRAVFLSYASQDAAAVARVAEALRASGVEVWFDKDELVGGDAWDAKIRGQIASCALFVPVISAATQARREGYFRIEWKLAAQRTHAMADGTPFLLPVVIDATRDAEALVPAEFRAVQWTRLAGGEGAPVEKFCARVQQVLGDGAALPSTPGAADPGLKHRATLGSRRRSVAAWTVAAVAVVVAVGLGTGFWRYAEQNAATRRLHEVTVPEIERQIAAHDIVGAFAAVEQLERALPGDPVVDKLWEKVSLRVVIASSPPGAVVSVRPYAQTKAEWRQLGPTPLRDVRLPRVYLRWKITEAGSAPDERVAAPVAEMKFALEPAKAVPREMVRVAGGGTGGVNSSGFPGRTLTAFLIDRHEVTNRQFKAFVDAGGYADARYWTQPFVRGERTLTRAEAMAEFRDRTGLPGPAGWSNGTYAADAAELPVTGVSWFEAAAYAEWAGKRLPTVFHWRMAARVADTESSVPLSNFGGKGLAPAGVFQGMSASGVYDMAGNAKEWCSNAAGPDTRYILGGSWREPDYMFVQADALSPFDRTEVNGFRCLRPLGNDSWPANFDEAITRQVRDYAQEKPVSDETFRVFRSLFSYDKGPLDARIESTDDSDPRWRREKVSYRAAYGDERVAALVFLPRNAAPPYQTILFFPGSGSISAGSSETNLRDLNTVAVLAGSGRAVIYPIYKGTYERRVAGFAMGIDFRSAAYRDWGIMLAKDLGRTVDYLETRSDLQSDKVAYVGQSWGGALGAFLPALENRIKVSVLIVGGFLVSEVLPEVDQINFAPRITVPTLMLGGRYDFQFPLEQSQRPMFRWLGAPAEHKKHVLFETGHALKPEQVAGEAYAWLDRYLGSVK